MVQSLQNYLYEIYKHKRLEKTRQFLLRFKGKFLKKTSKKKLNEYISNCSDFPKIYSNKIEVIDPKTKF